MKNRSINTKGVHQKFQQILARTAQAPSPSLNMHEARVNSGFPRLPSNRKRRSEVTSPRHTWDALFCGPVGLLATISACQTFARVSEIQATSKRKQPRRFTPIPHVNRLPALNHLFHPNSFADNFPPSAHNHSMTLLHPSPIRTSSARETSQRRQQSPVPCSLFPNPCLLLTPLLRRFCP